MKIGIVGLGLIGGSLAKALKYNTSNEILGTDIDRGVLLKAKLLGAIDDELLPKQLPECDLVITALYPQATLDYVLQNAQNFKKGAIVMDCCGVKRVICDPLWQCAKENGFTFYGAHPMAGLHFSGFAYSEVHMFSDASMILLPPDNADINDMERLKKLFLSIGFTNIQISTPEEHDRIIAYTSQLAHVVSNAYVKSPQAQVHNGFSAGSYKDLTRVAKLNADMWTELFLDNADNLSAELDGLIENLQAYSRALHEKDEKALHALLKAGSDRKEKIDGQYRS